MRTYNKTKSHQNIPRRNSASEQNWNPINSSSMSTSDTGIVSLSKGNVYYDTNPEGAEEIENGSNAVAGTDWNANSNWDKTIAGFFSCDGTSNDDLNQGTTIAEIGKSYVLSFQVLSIYSGNFVMTFGGVVGDNRYTTGIYSQIITATNTDRVRVRPNASGTVGSVTGISIKEVTTEEDSLYSKTLVSDEYGNLVELLRSSDIEDTSALGSYVNNQTIHNYPNERLGYVDGRPSNAEKDSNIKFTFEVDTNSQTLGSEEEVISDTNQFQLPLVSNGAISMNVDWGDGTSDVITTYNQAETLHTYAASGVYTIKITNEVRGWRFSDSGDKLKINDISNWGQFTITDTQTFKGCSNMTATATDSLIIGTTNLYQTFRNCLLFNGVVNNWNTRGVVDMQQVFLGCNNFNQPINNWNTSSVIYMNYMFANCDNFNQPLNNWNLSSAQSMFGVFYAAHKFNQPLNNWDVSSATEMSYMFFRAYEFNQSLNNWDVSSVTLTLNMFYQAYDFNQPLSFWDTSSFVRIEGMFAYATNFNQDLGNWNIESVTNMNDVMLGATLGTSNYDSLLTGWLGSPTVVEPELVTNGDFTQLPLGTGWTVSSETTDNYVVFDGSTARLKFLNTSPITELITSTYILTAGKTYEIIVDISERVSGGVKIDGAGITETFNTLGINTRIITPTGNTPLKFYRATANVDITFNSVSVKEILNTAPTDLTPNFGNSEYKFYGDAETARNELVNDYGWTITDGGGVLPVDESFTFSVDTDSSTLGSEMVDNSDFSLGDNGDWSKTNATISNGLAEINVIRGAYASIYQSLTYTSGEKYKLTATLSGTAGKVMRFQDNSSNVGGLTSVNGAVTLTGATQNIEIFFESNSNSQGINVARNSAAGDWQFTVTNVSVKKVLSDTDQFQLPLISSGDINMVVHWGDATTSNITSYNQAETLHTYASAGTYTINIYREVKGWKFNEGGDRLKMGVISNWGGFNITEHSSFFGCTYMTCTATTAPIISTTNLQNTFRNCDFFNGVVNNWDVRNVTDFYTMFFRCFAFNQPLNNWDTSSATRTRYMFYYCNNFNQPINNWEMKYVEDMGHMFRNANNFDQNISQWDITSIIDNSTSSMGGFMTNVTLSTANYDELLMQWEDSGSVQEPELISNGDFDEIGAEEILNGDFSEIGSEFMLNPNFVTDTNWGGSSSINTETQQLAKTSGGLAYQTTGGITAGNSYKIIVDVVSLDGATTLWVAGRNYSLIVGLQIIYAVGGSSTWGGGRVGINNGYSSGVGSVFNSISVKEVGQYWVVPDGSVEFNNGAIFDINTKLYQSNIIVVGKQYKVTYEVTENVGGMTLRFYNGGAYFYVDDSVGVHTAYFIGSGTNNRFYTSTLSGTSLTLKSISVKEVGQDWSISSVGGQFFNASGLSLNSSQIDTSGGGTVYSSCSQVSSFFEIGKSYKLVIEDLDITSGSIELKFGRSHSSTPPRPILTAADNGTYVNYFTAANQNDGFTINSNGGTVATLSSISVKEVLNSPPTGITTNFGGSRYTAEAIPARESLVNSYGWTIVDGGESV